MGIYLSFLRSPPEADDVVISDSCYAVSLSKKTVVQSSEIATPASGGLAMTGKVIFGGKFLVPACPA